MISGGSARPIDRKEGCNRPVVNEQKELTALISNPLDVQLLSRLLLDIVVARTFAEIESEGGEFESLRARQAFVLALSFQRCGEHLATEQFLCQSLPVEVKVLCEIAQNCAQGPTFSGLWAGIVM